jgi:hypothetical protein
MQQHVRRTFRPLFGERLESRDAMAGLVAAYGPVLPAAPLYQAATPGEIAPSAPTVTAPVLSSSQGKLTYAGQPLRIVFYGDLGMVAERQFDFRTFLDNVVKSGVNGVRVWLSYPKADSLSPFARAADGKYDITRFDRDYFARLRNFTDYAQKRGVFVQLTLFNGTELNNTPADFGRSPYNGRNGNSPLTGPQDFASNEALWRMSHKPLIEKVARELGDFRNVIYEVANEPAAHYLGNVLFHRNAVTTLAKALSTRAGSKLISVNADSRELRQFAEGDARIGLISLHISTGMTGKSAAYGIPEYVAKSRKPWIISNDGDVTMGTYHQIRQNPEFHASLIQGELRKTRTSKLISLAFAAEGSAGFGHIHFDFLDKGLNGDTWPIEATNWHPNYNPRAGNTSNGILSVLLNRGLLRGNPPLWAG